MLRTLGFTISAWSSVAGVALTVVALRAPAAIAAVAPSAKPSATPGPQPRQLSAQWNCKTLALDERGQPAGELREGVTVGTEFLLVCEGATDALQRELLALELPKEARYDLRILATREWGRERAEFIVTSWKSGEIKLENPVLSDGDTRVGLGTIEFKVESVIDPQQNPEGKPYGPWSPMAMRWPWWVWAFVAFVIGAFSVFAAVRVRRALRRKKFLRLLASQPIALKPYHQFNKDLRRLSRDLPVNEADWSETRMQGFVTELDQALRWYLARELTLPSFERSAVEIARDLRKIDETLYGKIRRDLVIALGELQKAREQKRLTVTDAYQMMDLARAVADHVHLQQEAEKERED